MILSLTAPRVCSQRVFSTLLEGDTSSVDARRERDAAKGAARVGPGGDVGGAAAASGSGTQRSDAHAADETDARSKDATRGFTVVFKDHPLVRVPEIAPHHACSIGARRCSSLVEWCVCVCVCVDGGRLVRKTHQISSFGPCQLFAPYLNNFTSKTGQ